MADIVFNEAFDFGFEEDSATPSNKSQNTETLSSDHSGPAAFRGRTPLVSLEELIAKQRKTLLSQKKLDIPVPSTSEEHENDDLAAIDEVDPNISTTQPYVTIIREDADIVRDMNSSVKRRNADDEADEKFTFHEEVVSVKEVDSFLDLRLCKPLLKALNHMGLSRPTPIQAACIPVALQHKDICACARTGSGKTIAFLAPIVHRLAAVVGGVRNDRQHITRALILSPTRELALQIFGVAQQLTQFLPNLIVNVSTGGHDRKHQENNLRTLPDIVVATPGRLIDHLHNTPGFHLKDIQFLVLDEADKMLDEYFTEQITEIIRLCNRERQTLLLSATMTDSVKELAAASLKRPVKLFVHNNDEVAGRLMQEFIRVRPQHEVDREAMLVSLVLRCFRNQCLVFLPTKRQCHRMAVLLGLLGCSCAEIHSDLSQVERNVALEKFKSGAVDILLATDLLARGMDMDCVQTVINYSLPASMKQYIHRVGRTARAGRSGRAVSLVGEEERKVLKEIVRAAPEPPKLRTISADVLNEYKMKLENLESDIVAVLLAEKEQRELRKVEQEMARVEGHLQRDGGKKASSSTEATVKRVDWFKEQKSIKKRQAMKEKAHQTEDKEQSLKKSKATKRKGVDMSSVLTRTDKSGARLGHKFIGAKKRK